MFAFEFENALFEFAAARPQFAPLFELPPNNHSSNTVLPTIGDMGFEVQSESQRPDLFYILVIYSLIFYQIRAFCKARNPMKRVP